MSEVIGVHWIGSDRRMGVVVLDNGKAYIGKAHEQNEKATIENIKEMGARLYGAQLKVILNQMENPSGT